jgi:hypothetical protein
VDVLTVVFGGLLAFFLITVVLLGLFSRRSPRDYLDWKPARSPEVEAENELDDVEQMLAAQNALRRRRGLPEVTEEEIEERVRADQEAAAGRRWPASCAPRVTPCAGRRATRPAQRRSRRRARSPTSAIPTASAR